MSERHHIVPVWFFVGILLLIYGVLIFITGLSEWAHPPDTVLAEAHASVWWGALMAILGAVYTIMFRPGRRS